LTYDLIKSFCYSIYYPEASQIIANVFQINMHFHINLKICKVCH